MVDFKSGLNAAWTDVAKFVPDLVLFLVILGVGYAAAKLLSKAISKVLSRVGFDRAVERGGIRKMLARSNYDASDMLAKLAFYSVMLFVLQLAFNAFGPNNAVSQLLSSVIGYLPKVVAAVVIIVVASAISAAVREIVDVALGSRSYGKTLANVCGGVFLAVGIFAALDQLKIASTITNAIFYAILAAIVGVTIVAIGGAGVRPMQKVWENSIAKVTEESRAITLDNATGKDMGDRMADRMNERRDQVRNTATGDSYADVRETPATAGAPRATQNQTHQTQQGHYGQGQQTQHPQESPIWNEQQGNQNPRRPQGF